MGCLFIRRGGYYPPAGGNLPPLRVPFGTIVGCVILSSLPENQTHGLVPLRGEQAIIRTGNVRMPVYPYQFVDLLRLVAQSGQGNSGIQQIHPAVLVTDKAAVTKVCIHL